MSSGQKVPFKDTKNSGVGGGHGNGDNSRWLDDEYLAGLLFIGLVLVSRLSGESIERLLNRNWKGIHCSPVPLARHICLIVPEARAEVKLAKLGKTSFANLFENRVHFFFRLEKAVSIYLLKDGSRGYHVILSPRHPFNRGGESLIIYHDIKDRMDDGYKFSTKQVRGYGKRVVKEYK